ncbi:MAG: pyridine nucleotide-disulfide oxidoreductase dimerization region [Planctomycetaceae bacterium]|nr:pyridine nucleotide-disulfide oxidoreductase dimerization region [Planctomycetaceae bacterium]
MAVNPLSPLDEFNRQLLSQVHPSDWVNPQPSGRYNLVVIGAGTAGLVTAAGAAGLGARVALIERDLMGGDCLNVGCVPSKALLRASRCVAEMRRGNEFGVHLDSPPQVDFAALMARLRRLRAGLSAHDSAARFQSLGVDVYLGEGRFTAPDAIQVGDRTLNFRRAVIATGARATRPSVPGLDDVGYLTNETVFNLTELPRRLAVIGAGPIGCELAQAFARLGSQVWLIDKYDQILPKEDPDSARIVAAAFRQDGVQMVSKATVETVFRNGPDKVLQCRVGDHAEEIRVDAILVGVGRSPNVEGLNLEGVGVAFDLRKGVQVNDSLRTTNPRIYAAGDVCSTHKFTHAADFQARIVIQNALFYGRGRASALTIPRCTYTSPEISAVGLDEHSAREQGIAINTFMQPLDKVDRAILDGEEQGFVKVHVRQGTDQILGATIVAAHAGDLISEISVAMAGKVGLKRLASVIHPYPTQADAIRKLGDAYNRTRLTPFVKRLFERWLKWTR